MTFWRGTVLLIAVVAATACSEEQQNKIARAGITWLEGDYKVTYADGAHVKSWMIKGGKVTTEADKGYYYFWAQNEAGKNVYIQTPIARSYIEEIK